eukprot:15467235-Alexandrium_andersonii.AAC.1
MSKWLQAFKPGTARAQKQPQGRSLTVHAQMPHLFTRRCGFYPSCSRADAESADEAGRWAPEVLLGG